MSLDKLRQKAIYQNSIDTWIAACEEKQVDWYETNRYRRFIAYLVQNGLNLKKFPLCIKETGGMYERGKDKTAFAETLSQMTDPNAAAYTIKLNDQAVQIIRSFDFAN
ncbi:hypothetical protein [Candidatus Nitrosotenuis uzonensis]|uniref:Uncharacterized protein n=1 Tax=Candidatus Nitrosotenuis uzonensis TaxID=1407055 RepID=A0A812F3T4_9ARCH|nr:hypothetical protein [Candidatus Nitrosotenuis uzonensis]CAE6500731.1 conserved hypothetical protein [Candidatus Nitrosotenuis uzonensis]